MPYIVYFLSPFKAIYILCDIFRSDKERCSNISGSCAATVLMLVMTCAVFTSTSFTKTFIFLFIFSTFWLFFVCTRAAAIGSLLCAAVIAVSYPISRLYDKAESVSGFTPEYITVIAEHGKSSGCMDVHFDMDSSIYRKGQQVFSAKSL